MRRQPATVRSLSDEIANVAYDDGVHSQSVELRDGPLPVRGAHVQLERWNGGIVSLYDPVRGLRYRTYDWPLRWSHSEFVEPLLLGLAATTIVALLARSARN